MKNLPKALLASLALAPVLFAQSDSSNVDVDALPDTAEGFAVNIVAREPHFINPAALAFDKMGRLYVGAGPQYRKPSEDTPGDYIKILHDKDEDGVAEKVTTFAEGFNNIQALAWKGDELWVANCPDVTVLRDTDGDLVADEYRLVFTGLGHLRHGLHGFNWAPDGRLYMSQGNSRVQDNAPQAFRDLMHVKSDKPDDQPLNKVFTKETYKKSFIGGWPTAEGGLLRCGAGGYNLEVFCRGNRNPWDMAMDTGFNWICSDNDPGPEHDRIFMPFQGAHFGMSHPWSFDWLAKDHLPTAPAIDLLPTVSGSGVGVVYYTARQFPEKYRNSFLIGDWTNKRIYHFPISWDGANMQNAGTFETLANAGATQAGDLGFKPTKGKSLFRPTDIAIAPDGSLYIAGWGAHYGSLYAPYGGTDSKAKMNYGRVFRLYHQEKPLPKRKEWLAPHRIKPHSEWTYQELLADLGSYMQVWGVNAQDELVRRGATHRDELLADLNSGKLTEGQETWAVWALARMHAWADLTKPIRDFASAGSHASLNLRLQAIRILGESGLPVAEIRKSIEANLTDKEPRLRFAAALALRNLPGTNTAALLPAITKEADRATFYAQWQTLRQLASLDERKALLQDKQPALQLAALLSLLEDDVADADTILDLATSTFEPLARTAQSWLKKQGGNGLPTVTINAPRRNFRDPVEAKLTANLKGYEIRYTLDGSEPTPESANHSPSTSIKVTSDLTLSAALFKDGKRRSNIEQAVFHKITDAEWTQNIFIQGLTVSNKHEYVVREKALQPGTLLYLDRKYTYTKIPPQVQGATYIQTANGDASSSGDKHLTFDINVPATIYVAHDDRIKDKPSWLKAYSRTDLILETSDQPFRLYKLDVPGGKVTLGGNLEKKENRASMYQVLLQLPSTVSGQTGLAAAQAAYGSGKPDFQNGEALFFGKGACMACHRVQGKGQSLGPDLSDLGLRAKPEYVLRSILEPSADIIEGYQQAQLELKDGSQVFGMVRDETAKALTIYLADGSHRDVPTKDIKKRNSLEISAMPPSYPYLFTPKETADITAWLLEQKTPSKK